MDLQAQAVEAMTAELERQEAEGSLKLTRGEAPMLRIEGEVDMESLAMAVIGAVAGSP
ncbi:MAG TPA: hypothetical protein VEA44_13500 [Caulobacter sp.]|nr:hypothetical protein [Caulobacter sp.]